MSLRQHLESGRQALGTLRRSGLLEPTWAAVLATSTAIWGPSLAAPFEAGATRVPRREALVDDVGPLSYWQLKRRSDRLAGGLERTGVSRRDRVGVLCTNHRGFVEISLAADKIGARLVYLNPSFGGPQLTDVIDREDITVLVHDEDAADGEPEPIAEAAAFVANRRPSLRVVPCHPAGDDWSFPTVDPAELRPRLPRPGQAALPVLLTSGTTGTPKGAKRESVRPDLAAATAVYDAIPFRRGDRIAIAPPLFHAWGLSQLAVAASLGGTAILRRRFDPERTLDDLMDCQVDVLAVVPVMLRRLLEAADDRVVARPRVVASSGSAIPPDLVVRWMDVFGDRLYNLYGSTEAGQATVAGPAELRRHPSTAGRPLVGTTIALLDGDGHEVADGEIGRIFVGNPFGFDGYTGGADKERIGDLVSIGDVGYRRDGLLFVTGRQDDMIVSGGENVFPAEVENLLNAHPDVREAAVVGVPDDEFGQRLAAFVARTPGSKLSKNALRDHVKDELARYKVPRDITWIDALPRNATGKILRNQLTGDRPRSG